MRSCREPSGADLNHSTISSLVIFAILGPPSALGSPHAAKRFIGLAIGVRTRSRDLRSLVHESHRMSLRQFIPAVMAGLLLAALLLWLTLGWLLALLRYPLVKRGRGGRPSESDKGPLLVPSK